MANNIIKSLQTNLKIIITFLSPNKAPKLTITIRFENNKLQKNKKLHFSLKRRTKLKSKKQYDTIIRIFVLPNVVVLKRNQYVYGKTKRHGRSFFRWGSIKERVATVKFSNFLSVFFYSDF